MKDTSPSLLQWQWSVYDAAHRNRANLLIHIATAPLFVAATIALAAAAFVLSWAMAVASLLVMAAAIALQGKGHALEAEPPQPFRGAWDLIARVFAEQFVTFPRFVLSGHWRRNLAHHR